MSEQVKVTHDPPKCPDCGANLFRVAVVDHLTYTFKPEANNYASDGSLETSCPECGADLSDVFPDGVCNYPKSQSSHIVLKNPCPKCECRSATVHYHKDTTCVKMIICDGCGEDLV